MAVAFFHLKGNPMNSLSFEATAHAFVSGKKPGKPMFRVTELTTVSLWSLSA